MIITFAANAAAKNESFSQKLPGNAAPFIPPFTPAAVFYRPLHTSKIARHYDHLQLCLFSKR